MSENVKEILDQLSLTDLLSDCPLAVLVEHQGQAIWANSGFLTMLGMDQLDSEDARVGALMRARESIELSNEQGQSSFLSHQVQPGKDDSAAVMHYFADQTALYTMQQQVDALQTEVEQSRLKDPITGLLTRRAMLLSLEPQVSRSRRYNNSLSVAQMTVEFEPGTDNSSVGMKISQLLKDQLRWADLIGLFEENNFVMVLPETRLEDAEKLAGKLCERLSDIAGVTASHLGITEWRKGDNAASLLQRSHEAMEKASSDQASCAIAS